jgi:lipopolysaccharide export system permease protein
MGKAIQPAQRIVQDPVQPVLDADRVRMQESANLVSAYYVEIHKKFALAVACLVFVILGAPIAVRFPRGGVGLTLGVSLLVFALYYVCLIGGEALAKRGIVPAFVSMWAANILFGAVGVYLLSRMGTEAATTRGGEMGELIANLRYRLFRHDRRSVPRLSPTA